MSLSGPINSSTCLHPMPLFSVISCSTQSRHLSLWPMTRESPNPGPATAHPRPPPRMPDHELLRRIGGGSYGQVWLARSVMGTFRAIKVIYRDEFADERPFQREFAGIQRFEPISRLHESQV